MDIFIYLYNIFLFYLSVDALGDATPVFSSSASNGAHAETWARLPPGRDLQWGHRDVEAAALDDQYVVQFFGLQGLACASGGEIDFLGGVGTPVISASASSRNSGSPGPLRTPLWPSRSGS